MIEWLKTIFMILFMIVTIPLAVLIWVVDRIAD